MRAAKRPLDELAGAVAAEEIARLVERARAGALERAEAELEDAIYEQLMRQAAGLGILEATPPPSHAEATAPPSHAEATTPPSPAEAEARQAWWAYCILGWDHDLVGLDELEGVEPGTSIRVVVEGSLAALVSPVPLPDYGDERLREHLEDIRWVERTARAHEAVLDAVLASTSIVPLRLCTLYRELGGVRRLLGDDAETFAAALRRIDGCQEWGVKAFAAPDRGVDEPVTPGPEGSGADYLESRRRQRDSRQQALEQRALRAEEIHLALSAVARDAVANPPQRQELHGRPETMVLNGAYLVEQPRVAELKGVVAELNEQRQEHGLVLELTGPWPAYNFVSAEAGVMA